MQNTLYLSHLAEARTQTLSEPEFDRVYRTLASLQQDPLGTSSVFSETDNLRVTRMTGYNVILRYVPSEHAVLVTDIEPAVQSHAAAA